MLQRMLQPCLLFCCYGVLDVSMESNQMNWRAINRLCITIHCNRWNFAATYPFNFWHALFAIIWSNRSRCKLKLSRNHFLEKLRHLYFFNASFSILSCDHNQINIWFQALSSWETSKTNYFYLSLLTLS